jgi:tetratricopeptide (TPR) repeat protein
MIFRKLGVALGAFLLFAGLAAAQTGPISGQVLNDGKPVPGAVIKIKRQESNKVYTVKTDKKGKYVYIGLPLAKYDVSVEVDGVVLDISTDVETTMNRDNPPEVNFDIKDKLAANKAASEAAKNAAAAGKHLTNDQARSLSPQQRAELEKSKKEQEARMAKDAALNSAYGAGRTSLEQAEVAGAAPADKAAAFASAVTSLKQASELDATQAVVWSHLAEAYEGLGSTQTGTDQGTSYQAGVDAWQKAIAITPNDAGFHNNYALLLAKTRKIDDAKAELQKAVELDATKAGMYYYNLGAVIVNAGQYEAAGDLFKKAIAADPKYADAHYQYGVCLVGQVKLDAKGNIVPLPGTKEEFQEYLTLTKNSSGESVGKFVEEAKAMLQALGSQIQTTYTNPNAAKKPAPKKKTSQ